MTPAFKEWSVIVDALGAGEQILLLRKGGLAEGPGGLTLRASRFWLFPTQFHAQQAGLKPALARRAEVPAVALREAGVPATVELRFAATVEGAAFITDLEDLKRLSPFHGWSDDLINERFIWRQPPGLHVWVLRVFRALSPQILTLTAAHEGCKSWIEVQPTIDPAAFQPVLDDASFARRWAELPVSVPPHADASPASSPSPGRTLVSSTPALSVAWTTVSTREAAEQLARPLVESGLIACAQIDGPITSIYRWNGKLEESQEFRLTLKFPADRLTAVERWVHQHHPYDTPEWIVVQADAVSEKYLSWAGAGVQADRF
ncbi:MAG: divalent cation tolerance protein CutA [Opitutaceae bacterium]